MTAQQAPRTQYRIVTPATVVTGSVALAETGILHGHHGLSHLRNLARTVPSLFAIKVLTPTGQVIPVKLAGAEITICGDQDATHPRARIPQPSPLERINRAVAGVQACGLKVRVGGHGVEHGEMSKEWIASAAKVVSPIGALLLHEHAEGEERDPEAAAADLLEVSWPWIDGCCNGMDAEPGGPHLHNAGRGDYLLGCEVGFAVRGLLVTICRCGARFPSDETCPSCEEVALARQESGAA